MSFIGIPLLTIHSFLSFLPPFFILFLLNFLYYSFLLCSLYTYITLSYPSLLKLPFLASICPSTRNSLFSFFFLSYLLFTILLVSSLAFTNVSPFTFLLSINSLLTVHPLFLSHPSSLLPWCPVSFNPFPYPSSHLPPPSSLLSLPHTTPPLSLLIPPAVWLPFSPSHFPLTSQPHLSRGLMNTPAHALTLLVGRGGQGERQRGEGVERQEVERWRETGYGRR